VYQENDDHGKGNQGFKISYAIYRFRCLSFSHVYRLECTRAFTYANCGMQVPRRKFNKLAALSCYLLPLFIARTRYHMVHRGKENKGTFNESGYICSAESIFPWCIFRSSLSKSFTFFLLRWHVCAAPRARWKRKKAVGKCSPKNASTCGARRKKIERHIH